MLVTFSVKRPGLMATNREILYMVGKTSERPWFTVYVSDIQGKKTWFNGNKQGHTVHGW